MKWQDHPLILKPMDLKLSCFKCIIMLLTVKEKLRLAIVYSRDEHWDVVERFVLTNIAIKC